MSLETLKIGCGVGRRGQVWLVDVRGNRAECENGVSYVECGTVGKTQETHIHKHCVISWWRFWSFVG